jgi:hypothetical protein
MSMRQTRDRRKLPTARFAGRSYTSTAERYTLFVHEDVCAKVKSCTSTSTRTIMPSCKQNPSRRSGLPVLSNHLASGHRQECPCYSLRFAMTLTLHYVRMRIAKLEGECPHEPWLQGNLNWVNRVSPVNAVKFRVRSPGSGVKIESFDFIDLRLLSRVGTAFPSCPLLCGGLRRNTPYLAKQPHSMRDRQECLCYSLPLMRKLPTVH